MQATATNGASGGASGKEAGNFEHLRAQYVRRRTELGRRMAEAASRSLAGAYFTAIKELDQAWVEATGMPLPEVPEAPALKPEASYAGADTEGAAAPIVGDSPATEIDPTGLSDPSPGSPPSQPVIESHDQAAVGAAKTRSRRRWRPTKSQAVLLFLGAALLAWLVTGVIWVGEAGTGRIIRDGAPVRAVVGPMALKWPWPIERFQPADPLDTVDPVIASDPRLAAADAEAARRGAASLRAAYQRLQSAATSDLADGARAEELMHRAAKAPKSQAGALYRKAANEFIRAMTLTVVGNVQSAITRWETVPPADQQRWQPRVTEASARLDEALRMFADGRQDEARQILTASEAALESVWKEYMGGLLTSARSALTGALADWDLASEALVKAGMPDPQPVASARAALSAGDGESPGQARLTEIREAHAGVVAATAQYREAQPQFMAARQAAEQARDAFRRAKKAEFPPDASQAEALMDRAPQALRQEGPSVAAAVYRQAAAEYAGAVALAAEGLAAQGLTQQRARAAELQSLRRSIDTVTEARAAALRRAVKTSGRVEELQKQLPAAAADQAGTVREQLAAAEAESAHAKRVVSVLEAAGVTDQALSALEDSFQSVRRSLEESTDPAIPREIVAQTARLGHIASLADAAVRAESAAAASAKRWDSLPTEARERWRSWLESPLARLQSGQRTLEAGEIEEAAPALEAARQTLDSLWDEFLAESVVEARKEADGALGQWNALTEPLAKLAPREPDQVREARSLLESAQSADRPAGQRAEMLRRAASLLSAAVATAREQRATVNIPDPDGRTPLLHAVADGDALVVESVLGRGADPNIPGSDGETPVVITVRAGRADLAWMLLAAGADRNAVAADGTPVLFMSAASPSTLQLFIDEAGRTRYRGRTILHEIAKSGVERKVKGADQVTLAKMVLDKFPALLRQKDPSGLTALELARQRGASELAVFLTQQESR